MLVLHVCIAPWLGGWLVLYRDAGNGEESLV